MYLPIYTIYKLPVGFLPYYDYFTNFRKMSFDRNNLNVFDKLNAPQVDFIKKERAYKWFDNNEFDILNLDSYSGVVWRVSCIRK